MKNLGYLFIALVFAIGCKNEEKTKPIIIGENINYSVNTNNKDGALPIVDSIYYNDFIGKILSQIKENKIKAYNSDLSTEINFQKIEENFDVGEMKVNIKDEKGIESENIVKIDMYLPSATVFKFHEKWELDSINFNLTKNVNALTFFRKYYSPEDTLINNPIEKEAFTIKCNPTQNKITNVVSNKAEYLVYFKDINIGINNELFTKSLINKVLNGEIVAYDYFTENLDKAKIDDIKLNLGIEEKIVMVENVETGEMAEKTVKTDIDYNEIVGLFFVEKWNYDFETSSFQKEIVAYGPVREYYRDSEEEKVKKLPFIIKLIKEKIN